MAKIDIDLKYVVGFLAAWFGVGFLLSHTIGALIGPAEGSWVLGRWKPLLDKAYGQMSPAEKQRVHQEISASPDAAKFMHQAGLNW